VTVGGCRGERRALPPTLIDPAYDGRTISQAAQKDPEIVDYRATLTADRARIRLFNEACLRRGVVKAVNKIYVSLAHTDADVAETLRVFDDALAEVARVTTA